ncbi:hypothetical protein GOODEAATRI_033836, partial [Goodea atripinnis]
MEKRDCGSRSASESFEGVVASAFYRETSVCRVQRVCKEEWAKISVTGCAKLKPDVKAMRTVVLRGLPVLLGHAPSDFYITCFV